MWIHVHSDFLACTCTDLITQQLRPLGYYNYGSSMTPPWKADMLKVYSCRLCSSSWCSKATRPSDSPLLPAAKEDVIVCGLCFTSGPGWRNLLEWYCQRSTCSAREHFPGAARTPKNYFRARTGSWFFKSVVPTGDGTTGQKKIKIQSSSPPASATHAEKPIRLFGSGDRPDLLVAFESLPVASQIIFSSELSI